VCLTFVLSFYFLACLLKHSRFCLHKIPFKELCSFFGLSLLSPWILPSGFGLDLWCRIFEALSRLEEDLWRHWRPLWTLKLELETRSKRSEILGEEYARFCLYYFWTCNLYLFVLITHGQVRCLGGILGTQSHLLT